MPRRLPALSLRTLQKIGSGDLARYMAFKLDDDGNLRGIEKFPLLNYDDLIGYERQEKNYARTPKIS